MRPRCTKRKGFRLVSPGKFAEAGPGRQTPRELFLLLNQMLQSYWETAGDFRQAPSPRFLQFVIIPVIRKSITDPADSNADSKTKAKPADWIASVNRAPPAGLG
jgi:hypothetical protein